jgi:hypothetical protein
MRRRILSDFMRGLSTIGLARKYGRTKLSIENTIRRAMR